ncbi:MAG: dihydroorotate dehydrogenase electron transfer subunit [Proteobacteria bacterium]|nr:MAG: dihydroorotate dehydrogenase electron transfer subunit [Pseudomonadota bacterium]QKK11163.1 MAG: dihydroorotate dehydrogenase electron transfer subunit [Pseudomonadota bacterium]
MDHSHRGTIFVEQAEILAHQAFDGDQQVLRVHAPKTAANARPGSFAHLQCAPHLPMRRPLSIMRVSPTEGWVDFLYKVVGRGTALLAKRKVGETIDLLGPIGKAFTLLPECPRPLLLGGGVGIPPMVFLAESMRPQLKALQPLVLMGSEVPFPFAARPSQILVPGIPEGVIGCMPLLDDWGIPSRLASRQSYAGCFDGYITDLARAWLVSLAAEERVKVAVYACGPHPMLEAVAEFAAEFGLPCQVSLEEFMACGVGGCAGCAVQVETPDGPAMKRVCVDGPVFDARAVFNTGA